MANRDHSAAVSGQQPDVAEILSQLREQIRTRRSQLAISDPNDPHALGLAEMRKSVEAVNDLWFVSAHLPINWHMRIVGRMLAYIKRLVRLLLRWYINPIVEQQNRFNSAAARTVTVMNAYQERMTREWMLLEERVARLETLIAGEQAAEPDRPSPVAGAVSSTPEA